MGLFLFLSNCSKSDEESSTLTFLEKYTGSVWSSNEDYDSNEFMRFTNDLNQPIESWVNRTCCYYYEMETLKMGKGTPVTYKVTQNADNNLEISYYSDWDGNKYREVEKLTLSVSGNTLKLDSKFYYDDDLDYVEDPIIFQKSTSDVESLMLCSTEENLTNTFLGKYGGMVLGGFNSDGSGEYLYFRFIKNTNYPMEFWFENNSCMTYKMVCSNNGYTLMENSSSKLEWKHEEVISGTEYVEIFAIEIIYDNIQKMDRFFATIKKFENGTLVSDRFQYYNPKEINVDELQICN